MKTALRLFDAEGRERAVLGVLESGSPSLHLWDAKGVMRAWFALRPSNAPLLVLSDESGTQRLVLGNTFLEGTRTGLVKEMPPSSVVLFDKDGKVLWRAP